MEIIKINTAEVILMEEGVGKGKIIIADPYEGNWSYYWGSMGSDLKSFIKSINSSYFCCKLVKDTYVFSGKSTARNIRKFIKDEMSYELPWHSFMSAQKELREKIKELEYAETQTEALYIMENIPKSLVCYDLSRQEEKEFTEIVESIFNQEPWHFLGEELSSEYKFLEKLHKQLKSKL